MKRHLAAALAVLIFAAPAAGASTLEAREQHINQYLTDRLTPDKDVDAWAHPKQVRVTDGFAHRPALLKRAWVSFVNEKGYVKPPKPEPVLASSSTPASAPVANVGAGAGYSANWDAIAACEGGSNWGMVTTGNGYYFVLQFAPSTWLGYGGTQAELDAGVAPSRSRLIQVAEAVLAGQGPGAWPNCFSY